MNKNRIIALIVALIISLSFCASCKKKNEDYGGNKNHVSEIVDKGKTLFENGKTDYSIIIPENAGEDVLFAATELNYFFKEATNCELRVSTDSADLSVDGKYLSIGKTILAEKAKIEVGEEFGNDGYVIETRDNSVIMLGGADTGSLYAVYDFIERVIGAKVYASDEVYVPVAEKIALPEIKVKEIPDIANRAPGLNPIAVDTVLRRRLRTRMYNEKWILWSHSYFQILPPAIYKTKYPEWYSPDGLQLCITNEEMTKEFIKNVINLVANDVNSEYIMLGQQDGASMCNCPECSAVAKTYKYSGLMMRFVNKVAKAVGTWIDENQPGRKMLLGTFAYEDTEEPPVVYDDKTKTYNPIDDSVLPEKNLALMFAPGRACYAHSFYADCNADIMETINGWNAIFKENMLAWIYNAQFGYYFLPFPNWSSTVEDYKILASHGFNYIYHQGTRETIAGALSEMRLFVQSKLMWNSDLDMNTLTDEFTAAFYRDAAPAIREYYDLYRTRFAMLERDADWHAYCMTATDGRYMKESVYPKGFVDRMEELFEKALNSVEKYKTTDKVLYEKLYLRIKKEQLTPRFLYLTLYSASFTGTELKNMIDEFEEVCNLAGITQWAELGAGYEYKTMANILAEWRSKYL